MLAQDLKGITLYASLKQQVQPKSARFSPEDKPLLLVVGAQGFQPRWRQVGMRI